jgi:hypothetical protein
VTKNAFETPLHSMDMANTVAGKWKEWPVVVLECVPAGEKSLETLEEESTVRVLYGYGTRTEAVVHEAIRKPFDVFHEPVSY